MSRYIDADSFFEEFEELDKEPYNNYPTADVRENVKGRWIIHGYPSMLECSNCRELFFYYEVETKSNFCPNCGADMRTDGHADILRVID